jgi:hypothetical protein
MVASGLPFWSHSRAVLSAEAIRNAAAIQVVEVAGCFIVQDAMGRNAAWFHFHDDATVEPLIKERVRRRQTGGSIGFNRTASVTRRRYTWSQRALTSR